MPLETIGIDASRASVKDKTGTEWYSFEIIRALAELDERPALRVYHRDRSTLGAFANVEDVLIERQRFWTHRGLDAELRRSPVDALFVPAHVLPRSHPQATVVTIHDLGYRHEPGAHTLRRRVMLEATTRWNARRAARIITPSEATSRDLERSYGVSRERVDVVAHGVDYERFRPLPEAEVQATFTELDLRQPYLLFISTLQPRKNLSRLISAFEAPELAAFQLVIIGAAGWKAGPIIDRMRASTRRDAIRWLGYVANEHIPALYNGAAAFVLPSLYEGFGLGVLEAMACGCPVVVSSAASLPEVAGEAGIVVDPRSVPDLRDGILQALDANESRCLRECGLRRAGAFTWQRAAGTTLKTIMRAYEETRD